MFWWEEAAPAQYPLHPVISHDVDKCIMFSQSQMTQWHIPCFTVSNYNMKDENILGVKTGTKNEEEL